MNSIWRAQGALGLRQFVATVNHWSLTAVIFDFTPNRNANERGYQPHRSGYVRFARRLSQTPTMLFAKPAAQAGLPPGHSRAVLLARKKNEGSFREARSVFRGKAGSGIRRARPVQEIPGRPRMKPVSVRA